MLHSFLFSVVIVSQLKGMVKVTANCQVRHARQVFYKDAKKLWRLQKDLGVLSNFVVLQIQPEVSAL
jgi:hypothetical protein